MGCCSSIHIDLQGKESVNRKVTVEKSGQGMKMSSHLAVSASEKKVKEITAESSEVRSELNESQNQTAFNSTMDKSQGMDSANSKCPYNMKLQIK